MLKFFIYAFFFSFKEAKVLYTIIFLQLWRLNVKTPRRAAARGMDDIRFPMVWGTHCLLFYLPLATTTK